MNNSNNEIVDFLAQEAEKNIVAMLEHEVFRHAGIQVADVIAAIVCKPGYDAVKNKFIADVGQGVYGDRFFVIWNTEDVINRAWDMRDIHLTDDAALRVLDWLDDRFDANIGIDWEQIDVGITDVMDDIQREKALAKGGSHHE